jgi:asparagine synthase (glutamine-hydrolysing)
MCGIAGWIGRAETTPNQGTLQAMTDAVAHRGPDGEGHWQAATRDGRHAVGLGHRRLAIIDLGTGQQPMASHDGRLTIVFNGEIYNFQDLRARLSERGHRFLTQSDTEVIVEAYRAWGPDCVSRFRGMFAFALWDSEQEVLLLARDPFGKKPLYLLDRDGGLMFASEVKSLLACPGVAPRLDRASVYDYLTWRYVPGPHTLFEGIRKMMPGSLAVWRDGRLEERVYYTPPDATQGPDEGLPDDPVAAFRDRLDECVRLRMVSDVPFGAFLSGGVDSSAIVALMSRHSELPIDTFSIGFREQAYSEAGYARLIARKFATHHHELVVDANDLMDHLPDLIGYRDAPVAEPSDIPIYLLSREASKSVKMVLTGEGSDEILGGYPKHRAERFVTAYQSVVAAWMHRALVLPLTRILPWQFRRAKTLIASLGLRDLQERMPRWFGALSFAERAALWTLPPPQRPPDPRPFAVAPGQSGLRRILYFDQASWLPDNLLERGDRMTMAASIEARMPFMDHRLVAFVSSLPDSFRIRGAEQKRILRQAFRDILPADILDRPKVGFRVPVNEWFQGPMREMVFDCLTGPSSITRDYYRPDMLRRLLDDHVLGRHNHEKLIWGLLNLELFQRRYRLN